MTVSLAASTMTPAVGASVTFTAKNSATAATGVVTFRDGATTLGTCTFSKGTCTFASTALAVGAHGIVASYPGDTVYAASTSAVPIANTSPMNKGGTQQVGSVAVTMTHAVHSCGILDGDQIIYGGEAAGYVLHLPDRRNIYCAGDTNVFTDMQLIERLYHPELAFLPIGDRATMGPVEAAKACELLGVKQVAVAVNKMDPDHRMDDLYAGC